MFSFLKRKVSPVEVAEGYVRSIRRWVDGGYSNRLKPSGESLGPEIVNDEWIYFDVFVVDYVTFLVFGESAARHAVLDPFSSRVTSWLKTRRAPPTPLRICPYLPADVPATFLPEESEPSDGRLKRRLALYANAVRAPSEFGGNDIVAMTFSTLCGVSDASFDAGVAAYFCFSCNSVQR